MKKRQKIKKEIATFNAVFLEESDGGYSVSVPALPGCFSQGDTFEAAVENIKEAIELYLEDESKEIDFLKVRPKKEFMVPVELYA
ncbi:MAG: type II toxin-antitoxin system HicB family antitoxin [Candidatus Sungbacteria bacterium]|nr:type II toxin-antitoxin system HicB family antitoxin [Candidatus Sungbacteria bacterium]